MDPYLCQLMFKYTYYMTSCSITNNTFAYNLNQG